MADKWRIATGLYSTASEWNGGTLPIAGDDVYCDGYVCTIDINTPQLNSMRNTQRSGGINAGYYILVNNIQVNANTFYSTSGSNLYLFLDNSVIIGNKYLNGNAILNGIYIQKTVAGGEWIINGNITQLGFAVNNAVFSSSLLLTIRTIGIINTAVSPYSILYSSPNITHYHTGDIYINGSSNSTCGYFELVGNGYGGNLSTGGGLLNTQKAKITGTCVGRLLPFIYSTVWGGDYTINGTSDNRYVTGFFVPKIKIATGGSFTQIYKNEAGDDIYMSTSYGGNPSTSDVRKNVVYGQNNELVGTCAVPSPLYVSLGVPVDNTVGTFEGGTSITPKEIWDYMLNADPTLTGSVKERFLNQATIDSTGEQIKNLI